MNGNSAVRYETAKWLKKAYGDNRKVRGPEGGHNGQRSAVCKPHLQKFPAWNGY